MTIKKNLKYFAILSLFSNVSAAEILPYMAINAGIGGIDIPEADIKDINYNQKSGIFSWSINTGLLTKSSLLDNFEYGIDLSYSSYATHKTKIEDTNFNYDGRNISVQGIAKYSFNNNWGIIGKFGAAYTEQELTVGNMKFHESEILPKIGISVSYNINSNIYISGGFDHIFGSDIAKVTDNINKYNYEKSDYTNVGSVNNLYIGIGYIF
ncbi:outer membrane beta-barrel protein [Aliivibrio sp. S2TY2]|uniref:outer membrane beta-barrel protein n=1 Tax=unclassified Aliivibrio TaxID=2645654 RepID=UPI0023790907|nr:MULTISPECIES: outer membrane beta-barrel protein [unclassified Aliivibrio]MDD9173503.1 outer membrane beta-barrel protein [Aliivibrio sp. S3TY1]MDD9190579.1 outer membrane beta-barrel protein [Aliivibrio sp. S2TY2]